MRQLFLSCFLVLFCHLSLPQNENIAVLKQQYTKALINANDGDQKKIASSLFLTYTPQTLTYYKLLLKEVNSNGILVTNGLEDTYAITILQHHLDLKTSVTVISLNLLNNDTYRTNVLLKLKLPAYPKTSSEYISLLLNKYPQKVYISSTVSQKVIKTFSQNIYLSGLTFNQNQNQQYKALLTFWEEVKIIPTQTLNAENKLLYQNLLPPLITLYKIQILNQTNVKSLKKDIIDLAKQVDQFEKVKQILSKYG
jgi:hypothetical protein